MSTFVFHKEADGLVRQYQLVERLAQAGDLVYVVSSASPRIYKNGDVMHVKSRRGFNSFWAKESFVYVQNNEAKVMEPTGNIKALDGKLYRAASDVRLREGDLAIVLGNTTQPRHHHATGDIVKVGRVSDDSPFTESLTSRKHQFVNVAMMLRVVPIDTPQTSSVTFVEHKKLADKVEGLQTKVSTLETEVATLKAAATAEKPATPTPTMFAAYAKKTFSRAQRDTVISMAKANVEQLIRKSTDAIWFEVRPTNRSVTAFISESWTSKAESHTYQFTDDEVFNEHIGKAIALRKLLGMWVPYSYSIQPKVTEYRAGDTIKWSGDLYQVLSARSGRTGAHQMLDLRNTKTDERFPNYPVPLDVSFITLVAD